MTGASSRAPDSGTLLAGRLHAGRRGGRRRGRGARRPRPRPSTTRVPRRLLPAGEPGDPHGREPTGRRRRPPGAPTVAAVDAGTAAPAAARRRRPEPPVAARGAALAAARGRPRDARRRADRRRTGDRAGRGEKHPVEDFLFTYYDLRVGALRRWHPGLGVVLAGPGARDRLAWTGYEEVGTPRGAGAAPSAAAVLGRRGPSWSAPPAAAGHRGSATAPGLLRDARVGHGLPRPAASGTPACRCASAPREPTRSSSGSACRAPTSTPSASSPRTPRPATRSTRRGGRRSSSSSRAACTPRWTCIGGPTAPGRWCRATCCWRRFDAGERMRACWTCGRPRTTCAPTATSRWRSRRLRAVPSTSAASAVRRAAAPLRDRLLTLLDAAVCRGRIG